MVPEALIAATRARKIVDLTYTKKSTGELVYHTGGIQEIGSNKAGNEVIWLWDTTANDHIRQFLVDNIMSYVVTDADYIVTNGWPIKLYGDELLPPDETM